MHRTCFWIACWAVQFAVLFGAGWPTRINLRTSICLLCQYNFPSQVVSGSDAGLLHRRIVSHAQGRGCVKSLVPGTGTERCRGTMFPQLLEDYVTEGNPVRMIDIFVDRLDRGYYDGEEILACEQGGVTLTHNKCQATSRSSLRRCSPSCARKFAELRQSYAIRSRINSVSSTRRIFGLWGGRGVAKMNIKCPKYPQNELVTSLCAT